MDINPPADTLAEELFAELIDEIAERMQGGERVDFRVYRDRVGNRWPEFEAIAQMLGEIIALQQSRPKACECEVSWQDEHTSQPVGELPADYEVAELEQIGLSSELNYCLGEFKLLRELGRGGMGVVYEAEQQTLLRRVALKVMAPGTPWTQPQLCRFQQETRAAALLRHPHIITIHTIGQDNGRYYYAMDLVDGGSVADIVEVLRRHAKYPQSSKSVNPTTSIAHHGSEFSDSCTDRTDGSQELFPVVARYRESLDEYYRTVAQWGADLAQGLQHAHEQGVIHRDVKPSNILVDQSGHVRLADFGLARIPGAENLTQTGERLGTLRYMSPEQAMGQKMLDHRTDIYSLGATLYELATLQPAFDEVEPLVLAHAVAEKQPVLADQVAPRMPRDLARVIQKAMSKSPADRYQNAQELADDLGRFLRGLPVLARPVNAWVRAGRWANRHRLLASLATSTCLLTCFLAIVGPVWAWKYKVVAHEAETARLASERNRAELQKTLSQTLITSTEALENTPHINELHRDLVFSSLEHYAKLLEFAGQDRQVRLDVARGYVTLGRVIAIRFSEEQAIAVLQQAIQILQPCLEHDPLDRDALLIVQNAYFSLGAQQGNREFMGKSVDVLEQLLALNPSDQFVRSELGAADQFYGEICRNEGDWEDALQFGMRSVATYEQLVREDKQLPELQSGLAYSLLLLAETRRGLGDFQGAERDLKRGLEVTRPIYDWIHAKLRSRIGFAHGNAEYGDLLLRLGRTQEARTYLQSSFDDLSTIIEGFPESDWARHQLFRTCMKFAEYFERQGDFTAAEKYCQCAMDTAENGAPKSSYAGLLAQAEYRLAGLLWRSDRRDRALTLFSSAFEHAESVENMWSALAAWYALCPAPNMRDPQRGLMFACQSNSSADIPRELGFCQYRAGHWQAAVATLHAAQKVERTSDSLTDFYLAMAYFQLGEQSEAETWLLRGNQRLSAPSNTDWGCIQDAHAEAEALVQPVASTEPSSSSL